MNENVKAIDSLNSVEKQQSTDSVDLNQDRLHKFVSEFSHRLQSLTNQMQSVNADKSIDVYKVSLEDQLSGFLSLDKDLAWMRLYLDNQESVSGNLLTSENTFSKLKSCYETFVELSKECIQEHISCLQGNIFLVEQQMHMLNSRPQINSALELAPADIDIHLLSNSVSAIEPSAPPLESIESSSKLSGLDVPDSYVIEPSAPPLESMEPSSKLSGLDVPGSYMVEPSAPPLELIESNSGSSFLDCISRNLDDQVPVQADGSVHLTDITHRLADSVVNETAGMITIDCPVSFDSFYSGDTMYILYDDTKYRTLDDLFSSSDVKFNLYSDTAANWALEHQSDPMTRQKVTAMCKVILNHKAPTTFVSQAGNYNQALSQSMKNVKRYSQTLSNLFEDVMENVDYYRHQLTGITTELEKYNSSALGATSSQEVVAKLQDVNKLQVELSKAYSNTPSVESNCVGTSLLTQQLNSFCDSSSDLINRFNTVVESGYVQKVKEQCDSISDTISKMDVDHDVHSELLLEIKNSNFLTLKLISQIEDQLNKYKFLMVQLRQFSNPEEFQKKLLQECEFEINRLESLAKSF